MAVHLLREIRSKAERQLENRCAAELVCTYPTAFSKAQVDALSNVYERVQADIGDHYGPDVVPFHIDPEGLQGLAITREVAGGVPQSEADPVVAWFDA